MGRGKRIYILIIKVNKLFSFFSSRCFLKEIENMYSVFLLSYRNTRESFGELEKVVESTSRSPKLPFVFLFNNRPFPSSLVPLFQSEPKCETFHMKMNSACSFIFMQMKVIFIRMVSHLDSL